MRESALYIMQLIERVIVSDDPKAKVAEIIADLQPSLPADLLDRYRKAPTEPPTPQDAAWLLEEWHKWS
jgi:hypothetical protein